MCDFLDHHAYGIAGQAEAIVPKIISELKRAFGFRAKGNPDFRQESYAVMGIDEARALKEAAERTSVLGGKKIFIVAARGITKEAQNALLKTFEEPTPDTLFFLIVPSIEILLPTLRSRLHVVVECASAPIGQPSSLASDFLGDPIPKRIKIIQGLLKNAEEKSEKRMLTHFLDELERCLAVKERRSAAQALGEVLEVKKYSRDRAPSFKLILEHLALTLPR